MKMRTADPTGTNEEIREGRIYLTRCLSHLDDGMASDSTPHEDDGCASDGALTAMTIANLVGLAARENAAPPVHQ